LREKLLYDLVHHKLRRLGGLQWEGAERYQVYIEKLQVELQEIPEYDDVPERVLDLLNANQELWCPVSDVEL